MRSEQAPVLAAAASDDTSMFATPTPPDRSDARETKKFDSGAV